MTPIHCVGVCWGGVGLVLHSVGGVTQCIRVTLGLSRRGLVYCIRFVSNTLCDTNTLCVCGCGGGVD